MDLTVDYIFNFSLSLIRKNQAGGLSNEDFQRFWNDESNAYQDDMLGRFQARNNGKTGINTGLVENETILQKLSIFIHPVTLIIVDNMSDKPDDFIYRLALRIDDKDVIKINHNQKATVLQSVIDPPSITDGKYYFTEYEGYYEFLPTGLTSAVLDYISTPIDIIWGFTFDGDGRQVYDPTTSVQPQWDANSCREITKRMLKNIGVSFKDGDFLSFGNNTVNTGE